MITTVLCSICSQLNNKPRVVFTDFRLHHTCSIIILWLHSLSGVIRSLLCNPHAFSPAINILYPCRSCEIPCAHVCANTEKIWDCHLVARTCDNEVGVAISIRDPYTSPFTSRCKWLARCLLLVRCLCSETVAIGFLSSVEPNFVEITALGSLKRHRSYSRWVNDAITSERSVLKKNPFLYLMPISRRSRWYCCLYAWLREVPE